MIKKAILTGLCSLGLMVTAHAANIDIPGGDAWCLILLMKAILIIVLIWILWRLNLASFRSCCSTDCKRWA